VRAEESHRKWPRIALIGAYPPPYGGVGVHLQRLESRLEKADLDFRLFNTVSEAEKPPRVVSVGRHRGWWFLAFCLRHKCRVAHLVTTNWYSQVLFGLTARWRRGAYVMSIHNMAVNAAMEGPSRWRAALTCWMLRQMDAVIACNTQIARACCERAGVAPRKVVVVPAFIPPDSRQASPLPRSIAAFCRNHHPLLFGVIWAGKRWQGQDLYGSDMMATLLERLLADYPSAGLVLVDLAEGEKKADAVLEAAEVRLAGHVMVVRETLTDITGLYQASDLFLRPTNTDGDANSIREALWLGTPVVASDAVPRPEACTLFRNRDVDDFERQTRRALANLPALRSQLAEHQPLDNAQPILELYAQLQGDQ
jgi:glycosyltransferase involved in cell wall biosynthesis